MVKVALGLGMLLTALAAFWTCSTCQLSVSTFAGQCAAGGKVERLCICIVLCSHSWECIRHEAVPPLHLLKFGGDQFVASGTQLYPILQPYMTGHQASSCSQQN